MAAENIIKSITLTGRLLRRYPTRISRAAFMFLPVLPLAGLIRAAGDGLQRAGLAQAVVLSGTADAIFAYVPLLLAICLAWGLVATSQIMAAVSGGLAFTVMHYAAVLTSDVLLPAAEMKFQMNILSGLVAGILAALVHQLCGRASLPIWLRFFAGKRLVLIIIVPVAALTGMLSGYIWQLLANPMLNLGAWVYQQGPAGAFVYGTLSRLFLPLGLDQVLNQQIWYQVGEFTNLSGELIRGEAMRFLAGDPTAGRLQAGFYPMAIFAVPAISACLVLTARKGTRLVWSGCYVIVGLTSLISGIILPFEIFLLFISPPLFLLYGLLCGLSLFITWHLDVYLGFIYGAGLADYLALWHFAAKPGILLLVGAVMAHASFATTYAAVRWLRFPTLSGDAALPADIVLPVKNQVDEKINAEKENGSEAEQE